MDATAFALARETSLPIIVFSIAEPGFDRRDSAWRRPRNHRRRLTAHSVAPKGEVRGRGRRDFEGET